ncbi:MAG: CHAD domain-containing protein [Phycisphaerales bacterium]|nr:CHAD domain-containing protein [Phycisphaerales bacterium]
MTNPVVINEPGAIGMDAPASDDRTRDGAARADSAPPLEPVEFVRRSLWKRFKAVSAHEANLHGEESAEALHDMRVATRRLRAALRVFRQFLPEKLARRCERRVRKLTRGLGSTREWDVHAESLARIHAATIRVPELAAIEHVLELIDARRGQERVEMMQAVGGCDLHGLGRQIRDLTRRAEIAQSHNARVMVQEALSPMVRTAFDDTSRLREREVAEELHAQRIAVKRLRYAVELLEPMIAGGAARLMARLKHLQELLGKHHDLVLLEELLARVLTRLTDHGRRTLAEGLVGPIDRLRVERRECFDDYFRATDDISTNSVWEELGI